MKLMKISDIEGVYLFYCPACKCYHWFSTSGKTPSNPNEIRNNFKWQLSGTDDKPTIRASILVRTTRNNICHLFVTDGKIQYLTDCTHEYAGKTVDMVETETIREESDNCDD